MTDLTAQTLARLRSRTLPGLQLPPEFILPDYDGGSIANLPSQAALWLSGSAFGKAPLHTSLAQPLGEDIRQVILVLMDAFGFQRFQSLLTEPGSIWQRIAEAGLLAPMTSVFPSTTAAALTSIATGRAPGEHNMLGYEMWLKEYGAISNMISFSPVSAAQQPERLREGGFDPEHFLSVPIWARHLQAHGVAAHAFMPSYISNSGLARMHLSGLKVRPYFAPADLWISLRRLLEASTRVRQFVWVYWSEIDTLSHVYGPSTEAAELEARHFGETLARACLDRLSPAARAGTAIVVVADHGQVDTPAIPDFDLKHHPDFTDRLHILPSGENRAAYLHCRPGQVKAAQAYLEDHWPDHFQVIPQADVMASGLLGDQLDPRTASRLGELLVLAKGQAYLWWANKENPLLGRHGGLTADEMLVPFLAARLDDWLT